MGYRYGQYPLLFQQFGGASGRLPYGGGVARPAWAQGVDWWRNFETGEGNMPLPSDTHPTQIKARTAADDYVNFPTDVLCLTNLGLQTVPTRTNSLRNNSMQGAVPGTPGTLPTFWVNAGTADVAVVGGGIENGVIYMDAQFSSGGSDAVGLYFEQSTQIAAVDGQTWAGSFFYKLVSGTPPPSLAHRISFYDAASDPVDSNDFAFTPEAELTRCENTLTGSGGTIASVRNGIVSSAEAFDFTLRIGFPQLELGTFVSPPITTANGAITATGNVQLIMDPPFNGGVCGFVTVDARQPAVLGVEHCILEINHGGSANRFMLFNNASNGNLKVITTINGVTGNAGELGAWMEGVQTIAFVASSGILAARRVEGGPQTGPGPTSWPSAVDRIAFGGAGYTTSNNTYQSIKKAVFDFGPQNAASFNAMYARAQLAASA